MLSEEDFKNKHLQHPITFLTEENLDKLETHCRKAVNFERGVEHKVVLELLDKYYQYQKEIKDKNNKIIKLQKENEEKDKQIDLIAEKLAKAYHYKPKICSLKEKENIDCNKYNDCTSCVKQYFETKAKGE